MPTHARNYTIALHIEGLCTELTPKSNGILLYWGKDPNDIMSTGATQYVTKEVLRSVPTELDARIDLFSYDVDYSSLSFGITATEEMCKLFLSYPNPAGTFIEATTTGSPSVLNVYYPGIREVNSSGVTTWPIYHKGEVMSVNAVTALGDDNYTLNVTRALAWVGDIPDLYTQDDSEIGDSFYEAPVFMKNRIVTLYLIDHDVAGPGAGETGNWEILWRGFIDGVSSSDDQTEIEIDVVEFTSKFISSEGGIGNNTFNISSTDLRYYPIRGSKRMNIFGKIRKSINNDFNDIDWVNPDYAKKFIMIDGAIYLFEFDANGDLIPSTQTNAFGYYPEVEEGNIPSDTVVKEVLLVDRKSSVYSSFNGVSDPSGLEFTQYNPIAMALAMLLSTGDGTNELTWPSGYTTPGADILGRQFGVGIPSLVLDNDSWVQAIDDTEGKMIDRLVLGHETFDVAEEVRNLLSLEDYYIVLNEEGLIALKKFEPFSAQTMYDIHNGSEQQLAYLIPDTIKIDKNLSDQGTNVKAEVGALTIGDVEPNIVSVSVYSGDRRDVNFDQSTWNFNYKYYDTKRALRNASSDQSEIEDILTDKMLLRFDNNPTLKFTAPWKYTANTGITGVGVNESGRVPPLGSWLRLRGGPETGLIGPDGTRIIVEDKYLTFTGLLTGYTLNLDTFNVECEVFLINWTYGEQFPKNIAPSMLIESYTHATKLITSTISAPTETVQNAYWRAYAVDDNSNTFGFTAGDEVIITQTDGKKSWQSVDGMTVSTISVSGVGYPYTVSMVLSTGLAGAGNIAADTIDQYVRLDNYDNYDNSFVGSTFFPPESDGRKWAYFANNIGTGSLGTDEDPSDIWMF